MLWITKPLIWPTFNFSHHVTAWGKKLCTAVKITASSSGNSNWAVFKFRAFKKAFCDSWMDSNWANTRSKLLMYSSMDRFSYHLLPIHPFDPVLVIIYWLKNFVNMTSKNVMPLSMQIDLSQFIIWLRCAGGSDTAGCCSLQWLLRRLIFIGQQLLRRCLQPLWHFVMAHGSEVSCASALKPKLSMTHVFAGLINGTAYLHDTDFSAKIPCSNGKVVFWWTPVCGNHQSPNCLSNCKPTQRQSPFHEKACIAHVGHCAHPEQRRHIGADGSYSSK